MSLLRILRNLAVLVILTVGFLSLSPRPIAAQSTCGQLGAVCTTAAQCCVHYCSPRTLRCCIPLHNRACTNWTQCCSGMCSGGRCL